MKPPIYAKLVDKAVAAITSAVEVYNKPGFQYRDETFSLLALNAWELLLKARLVQISGGKQRAIFVYERRKTKSGAWSSKEYLKRSRSNNPLTIGIRAAAGKLDTHAPSKLPDAVKNNLEVLIEVRDCAAHYFSSSLSLRRQLLEVGVARSETSSGLREGGSVGICRRSFKFFSRSDSSARAGLLSWHPQKRGEY
jgi:hypothetical protein